MSVSGWEPLPDVTEWWESLLDVRQLSGGPPGCPRALTECPVVVDVRDWLGGFARYLSGQEALSDVREWLGGLSECP